ncbi:MAG: hypothetical protein NVSMB47_01010 [Polyangiales bacterium]
MTYDDFAKRIVAEGVLTDPWMDGKERFQQEPIFLDRATQGAMYRAAEDVAAVYNEMCLLVADDETLLDRFFGLTPFQQAMWRSSQPIWHGIARADVFLTDEGLAFAELNCDTPTGEAEAVVLNALVARDHPGTIDPNLELEARFCAMLETLAARELDDSAATRVVGLVYPTEFTEDLSLVRLYRRWLESRGYRVVLGSPYNLENEEGRLKLFDTHFSILLRHYKTDWWGERVSPWDDDTIADLEPLHEALAAVIASMAEGQCAVVNPFGAVLPQNKRSMAMMWEHIHRFSPHAQSIIERHIPLSARLETMHEEQLFAQRTDWVIKSDYGSEGDEVIVGRHTTPEEWRQTIAHARPGRWIAQRYFQARLNRSDSGVSAGSITNFGVYLVAGEAAGLYARIQAGPTTDRAVSAPVLIKG